MLKIKAHLNGPAPALLCSREAERTKRKIERAGDAIQPRRAIKPRSSAPTLPDWPPFIRPAPAQASPRIRGERYNAIIFSGLMHREPQLFWNLMVSSKHLPTNENYTFPSATTIFQTLLTDDIMISTQFSTILTILWHNKIVIRNKISNSCWRPLLIFGQTFSLSPALYASLCIIANTDKSNLLILMVNQK